MSRRFNEFASAQTGSGWHPSAGAFTFGGAEIDGVEAGGFHGAIHEYDSRHGSSTGLLIEGWLGG